MIWVIIYLIGMAITLIEIIIAVIKDNLFSGLTPGMNVTIAFLGVVLWPIFHIMLIVKWKALTKLEKKQ